jgi:uncharacterized protein (DUF2267 family)
MMRGMSLLTQMVTDVRALGRIETDALALQWLRAATSTMSDWGGKQAREALESALPKDLFSGAGTRGRSLPAATSAASGSAAIALVTELGRRAGQEDPAKMAQMAAAALGLLKENIPANARESLLAALPPDIATEVRKATVDPRWKYFLIPQSYARPRSRG